jgi:hypothetical protein
LTAGVGSLKAYRKDLKAPEAPLYATQCAVFRRIYAYQAERTPRSPRVMPLAFRPPATSGRTEHQLVKTHLYEVQKGAGQPQQPEALREALAEVFRAMHCARANLRVLWGRAYLAKVCLCLD